MDINNAMAKYLTQLYLIFFSIFLVGCASQQTTTFEPFHPHNLNEKIRSGHFTKKVDNVLVIMDASSSMNSSYKRGGFTGTGSSSKFEVEKEILNRFNQTIPELNFNIGLRSFGYTWCLDWSPTILNEGIGPYSKSGFSSGLNGVQCASGGTPMQIAIDSGGTDLQPTQGDIAVILISDGKTTDDDPIYSVNELNRAFGDRLCFYTIWVGNEKSEEILMKRLASIGDCGFSSSANDIASSKNMAQFVESVFLAASVHREPVAIPDEPEDPDDDHDGVPNSADKCPNTPSGARVNRVGCWIVGTFLFDFDESVIKPEGYAVLDEIVSIFRQNPELRVRIEGHTDNIGSINYNRGLSQRRADAVRSYFVDKGIRSDILSTKGLSSTQPVTTNDTPEGRAENRRVELKILN